MEKEALQHCIRVLKNGGLTILPTDTIPGISCLPLEDAVERVYQIKQRSKCKPFIFIVSSIEGLQEMISKDYKLPINILKSLKNPTTILYKAQKKYLKFSNEKGEIAIRWIQSETFSQKVLKNIDLPLISTSANFSGKPPAKCLKEVPMLLRQKVDYIPPDILDYPKKGKPSQIMRINILNNKLIPIART